MSDTVLTEFNVTDKRNINLLLLGGMGGGEAK